MRALDVWSVCMNRKVCMCVYVHRRYPQPDALPLNRCCLELVPTLHMLVADFLAVLAAYGVPPAKAIVNVANNHACVPPCPSSRGQRPGQAS